MSRLATAPSWTSNSAWPVCRMPDRPAMRRQRSRASAASAGLPSGLPLNSSSESAPMTSASVSCLATAAALAAASSATCSATAGRPDGRLVDLADHDLGREPGLAEQGETGGGGRGKHEPAVGLMRTVPPRASRRARAAARAGGRRRRTPTRRPASDGGGLGAGTARRRRRSARRAPRPWARPSRTRSNGCRPEWGPGGSPRSDDGAAPRESGDGTWPRCRPEGCTTMSSS